MPASSPDGSGRALLANLLGFCRYLRRQGLTVGANQVLNFARALQHVDIRQRDLFFHTAETTLLNRAQDRRLFHQAFERYWRSRRGQWLPRRQRGSGGSKGDLEAIPPLERIDVATEAGWPESAGSDGEGGRRYSALEVLRQRDFTELSESEQKQVARLVRAMAVRLATRRSRRWVAGSGERLELRGSLRLNLRHGGEWLRWARRGPKTVERPMVLLADISGSMERYSRLLLHFAFGLSRGSHRRVEVFVFGTRLTRITRALQVRRIERAMVRVASAVPDWSGGTRIGGALRRFNLDWARRMLARRPLVLVISDGWDRGDPMLLAGEVARLQRSVHRLIWLNPRLGGDGFAPETRGMRAALPHIDHFMPVHNLASLEELGRLLRQLADGDRSPGERSQEKRIASGGAVE